MHVDEIDIDIRLVAGLLAAQFREWADLARWSRFAPPER